VKYVRIVRTIMAVVLALAVAAMPAAASAVAAAGTTHDGSAAVAHSAAMPADCPHHHAPADHGHKSDGAAMAACAVKCFTYAGTVVPTIVMAPKAPQPRPLVRAGPVASKIAAPPFRPPRV
jgi:hypothetical protein